MRRWARVIAGGWIILSLLNLWVPPYEWSLPLMAALAMMYGGWMPIAYFFWRDSQGRLYWGLLGMVWMGSWLLTYRLWSPSASAAYSRPAFRLATWNLDASDYDRNQIEKDLDFIHQKEVDVVCLQEVYLGDYSIEGFAKRAGYPYIIFGKAGPAMGMAILSRYPLFLHQSPFLLSGSTNGILIGKVLMPNGDTILMVNVHYPSYRLGSLRSWNYDHWRSVWAAQRKIDTLLEAVSRSWAGPIWICGDFNAIPLSYAVGQWWRRNLQDSYFAAEGFRGPTWRPIPLRIDYIWGPCSASRQKSYWIEKHQHAYLMAEYSQQHLEEMMKKSVTFAKLGR